MPARTGQSPTPAAILLALATGIFIAAYTIWDKIAVTTVGNPPLLQGYAALAGMVPVLAPFALAGRRRADPAGLAPLPAPGARRGAALAAGLHPRCWSR